MSDDAASSRWQQQTRTGGLCFSTRGSSLRRKETAPTREVLRLSSKRRGGRFRREIDTRENFDNSGVNDRNEALRDDDDD